MKKLKWMAIGLVLVSTCVWIPSAAARPPKVDTPQVHADTKASFDAVADKVRGQMVKGGRFGFVSKKEFAQVNSNLDAMEGLFAKYGDVANMNNDTKVALFNHQEVVNGILLKRDNNRLICSRMAPTGSHIRVTKCRTYGEIQRQQTVTKDWLQDHWMGPQMKVPDKN